MRNAANSRLVVPLTGANRTHLKVSEKKFEWTLVSKPLKLTLLPPDSRTNAFYFLRDYHGGADGRVWLAASVASGRLAVIKFISGSDAETKASDEAGVWNKFKIRAYSTTLINRACVVMPYAAHVKKVVGELSLLSELNMWCVGSEGSSELLDIDYYPMLQDELSKHTPLADRMKDAINYFAANRVKHNDIEWRHLAVLPVFDGDNLVRFQNFLIDLSSTDNTETSNDAEAPMLVRFNTLLGQYS